MLVAVNTLGMKPGQGGGEELYLRRTLDKMAELQKTTSFVLLTDRENADSFNGFDCLETEGLPALSQALAASKADALFSPFQTAPRKASVPVIVYVMELYSIRKAAALKRRRRSSALKDAKEVLSNAVAVVVPSDYVKREILELLEVPLDKSFVAPLGISDAFAEEQSCIVEKPYFLVVGRLSERKNIPLLLEAFGRIASEIPMNLVVVGRPSEDEPEHWGERIVRIDRVGTTQLAGLYQHSDLVIVPSLYEGSGVLVLKTGARVATGRVGGITEVAGDAPIFFNPESVDSLVGAMRRAVGESEGDRERRRRSAKQATRDFTWEKTAWQTLAAFRRATG